jgi:hypothetical protein
MKNRCKFFRIISLIAITGFFFASCGDNDDDNSGGVKTDAAYPVITVQPVGGVYLPGASVTPLSVTASVTDGGSLTYQWYSTSTPGTSGGTAVSGATSASFTPSTVTAGTVYYYTEVTNTNNSVDGTKTAVRASNAVKFITGWESLSVYEERGGSSYSFSPNSIIFANNRFVAVGGYISSGGQIGWSDDGINWQIVANSTFGSSIINGIAYGNSRFIAVGDDGKVASSSDGKTWASVDAGAVFGTSNINDIAYGYNRFFAVGDGGKTAYLQNNETTWTSVQTAVGTTNMFTGNSQSAAETNIRRIVSGDKLFIAYAFVTNGQLAIHRNGTETTTWQGDNVSYYGWTGAVTFYGGLIYANNYFVFAGNNGSIWKRNDTDSNSANWTNISPSSVLGTNTITGTGYGAGKLFAFSDTKGAWSSDDGATWTEVQHTSMTRMAYGAGRFVTSSLRYSTYP